MFTSTHVQPRRMAEAPAPQSSNRPRRAMPGAAEKLRHRATAGVGALAVAAVVGASVVASASASGKQSLSGHVESAAQVKAAPSSSPTPRRAEPTPDAASRVSHEISRSRVRVPQRGIMTPDTVQGRMTGTPSPRATPSRSATKSTKSSSAPSRTAARPSPSATRKAEAPSSSVNLGVDTSGLSANTVGVMKAIKARFPQVTFSTGGDQDHATGHAVDLMTSSSSTGDAMAEYVRANHSSLGVHYVIWSQKIWNVQRNSEGWRAMEDRGSATANHYDHVHVSVF